MAKNNDSDDEAGPVGQEPGVSVPADHSEDWEGMARHAVRMLLWSDKDELESVLGWLEHRFGEGEEVTADDINDLRNALLSVQYTVEDHIVPHVEGVSAWERVTEGATFGQLADALGVDLDDINELLCECDPAEDAEDVLNNENLVSLRANLEEGLSVAQHKGADRETTARLLELYAEAVREGHERPAARRGRWWREAHREGGDECDA